MMYRHLTSPVSNFPIQPRGRPAPARILRAPLPPLPPSPSASPSACTTLPSACTDAFVTAPHLSFSCCWAVSAVTLLLLRPTLFLNLHWPTKHRAKADSTLRSSRAVPHPSTNRALSRLTSEVRRDPVYSTRYGRQRIHSICRITDVSRPKMWPLGKQSRQCLPGRMHSDTYRPQILSDALN